MDKLDGYQCQAADDRYPISIRIRLTGCSWPIASFVRADVTTRSRIPTRVKSDVPLARWCEEFAPALPVIGERPSSS
jgi:hypothetical protein